VRDFRGTPTRPGGALTCRIKEENAMRSHARNLLCAAAAVLASQMTSTVEAQQPQQPQQPQQNQQAVQVECVKRDATATPPPHPAGPRPAPSGSRGGRPQKTESAMKPICPEGQVPVVREMQIEQRTAPAKGNPLLRPRSGVESLGQPTGGGVLPGDVRSFREIYRSRRTGLGGAVAPPAPPGPPPGPPSPPCAGVPSFGSCYYYGSAGFTRTADGAGMTMSVNSPTYNNSGGSGHSLDEIAVQGGTNNGNIVELGWLVSSDQNGDADPHIFVFHWKNWNQTCYNGCGWQQYSNTYFPGQNIKALVGREVYIGYVYYQKNWWAWFDNQWLGYFPGSEWNNSYTKSALMQWFGEVASQNGVPPLTQMGDGVLPPAPKAAHMFTLCDVDAKAWICWYRDQQSLSATVPKYYAIQRVGFGDTRYGGPGQ
jgi:Neprosin